MCPEVLALLRVATTRMVKGVPVPLAPVQERPVVLPLPPPVFSKGDGQPNKRRRTSFLPSPYALNETSIN